MRWLAVLLLMSAASALNVSYDGKVIATPGERYTTTVSLLSGEGQLPVACWGLNAVCPRSVFLEKGKENYFNVSFMPKRGEGKVHLRVGDEQVEIVVIGSNQTDALIASLEKLNHTFTNLERKYGSSHLIGLALSLVSEGKQLYRQGEYSSVEDILKNLDSLLKEYYSTLRIKEEAPVPSRLNFAWLSLLPLVAFLGALIRKRNKSVEHIEVEDVKALIKEEMGGMSRGKES